MKFHRLSSPSTRSLRNLLLAGLATFALHSASAVDGSWLSTASGTQLWSTGTNWTSNPAIPGGIGSTVQIETNITATTYIDLESTDRIVGILSVGDTSGSSKFFISGSAGGDLIFNRVGGAQLSFTGGGNKEISADITLDSDLAITSNNKNATISGFVSGTGSITQSGTGVVYLSKANTFTGGYILNGGEVLSGGNSSLGTGTLTLNAGTLSVGANLTFSNAINLGGNVIISGNGVADRTTNFNGPVTMTANSHVTTANGMAELKFSKNIDGSANLTMSGTGAVVLSNATGNTYIGNTIINAGTLLVNNTSGSGTGDGDVSVASGAVLGGSGMISGAVTITGSLRPGNSIGVLAVNNDVTWNAGDAWVFELGTAAASLASASSGGSTQDKLLLTGAGNDFIKGSGTDWTFNFAGGGAMGWYQLVDWTGSSAFVAEDFKAINLDSGLSGSFVVDAGTSALYLNVVPEPSAGLLLLGGLSLLMMMSLRRHVVRAAKI